MALWSASEGKTRNASIPSRSLAGDSDSYEILFELPKLFEEHHKDRARARNLFETALKRWQTTEANKKERDDLTMMQIAGHLARLAEDAGEPKRAVEYLIMIRDVSPSPEAVQKQIDELNARQTAGHTAAE